MHQFESILCYFNSCYTHIGPVRGRRHFIHLGSGCTAPRTPAHELFHALGRIHEQNRYDRNRYVQVYWNNIKRKSKSILHLSCTNGEL